MANTLAQSQQSISNFSHLLSELTEENMVNLENKEQVKFFLQFLRMFNVDPKEINIFYFEGVHIDIAYPCYQSNSVVYQADKSNGYIVRLGDMDTDTFLSRSGLSMFDNYDYEKEDIKDFQ
tara:strand:- start:529 stop:891 length:363 start_codon:yes stop_codon:yes gene_type:complete